VILDRVGHLLEHGEHRPGSGVGDGLPRGRGRLEQRHPHQLRVDELALSLGEDLGRPADDLAEDHSRIATRSHQRGMRHRVHDRLATHLVHLAPIHALECLYHRLERERHVVPRVAVGDREHVQVVHLAAPLVEVAIGGRDDPAESLDGGVRLHEERLSRYAALLTLLDFRQRVQT
jgi:hypothetical protein